jgi:hypothetical protein
MSPIEKRLYKATPIGWSTILISVAIAIGLLLIPLEIADARVPFPLLPLGLPLAGLVGLGIGLMLDERQRSAQACAAAEVARALARLQAAGRQIRQVSGPAGSITSHIEVVDQGQAEIQIELLRPHAETVLLILADEKIDHEAIASYSEEQAIRRLKEWGQPG